MSEQSRFVADSVEELLVALAEGVRDAQEALNAIPATDAFGRALPTYHLPFLDFTINVSVTTQANAQGRPITRLRPVTQGSRTTNTSSTIAGRLVASPPGDGLPVPQLTLAASSVDGGRVTLRLTAGNSAGETLTGQRIELNIDPQASAALSQAAEVKLTAPQPGTRLADAIVVTGEDGTAETTLTLDAAEPANAVIVVAALLGPARVSAAVVKP